jgi:hypothetical protein
VSGCSRLCFNSKVWFRTPRHPILIADRRTVAAPLLVVLVTPHEAPRVCTLLPGQRVTLCDIEGQSALFTSGRHWYRVHVDEFLNVTKASRHEDRIEPWLDRTAPLRVGRGLGQE